MAIAMRRRSERGAATVETTGVVIIAALLVGSLLLAVTPQARIMGETVSYWICQVVTVGQGGCTPPSKAPDTHKPTEPCVTGQRAVERNEKVSVIVVTMEDGQRIELSRMSNGEYRVTVTDTEGVGLETGAGAGVTVTVADKKIGAEATMGAGASLNLEAGDVYYTDSAGLSDLMSALTHDQVKDMVVGESGPIRWVVDEASKRTGIGKQMPEPDETYGKGGISLNAGAVASAGPVNASAGIDGAVSLGSSKNRDGSRTAYVQSTVKGEAGLQSLGFDTEGDPEFQGLDLSGEVDVVNAVTFDSSGNMVNMEASVAMSGTASGVAAALFKEGLDPSLGNSASGATVYKANLAINSQADKDVVNNYLLSMGLATVDSYVNPERTVNAQLNFFNAVSDRGQMTKVHYDIESSTPLAVDASLELGIELGVSSSVTTDSMSVDDAQYWDGAEWVVWEECAA
ncbi:hypothetical protein [Nocardioides gilvus]|uniref:hypothetical protein n=1 Tax=Nocardioides gilvus TaxID=1735589 RepID=UPI000D741E0F|nr:hypothetical protein [Nocardioides gilvus]